MTPRGIRLNNPGNIRLTRALWQGESPAQVDKDFVTFTGPEWGLRAIGKILLTYQKAGLDTVRKMISRWAPPRENDTPAYVNAVSHEMGVHPDTVVDLHDPKEMGLMIAGVVHHENGVQPYDDLKIAQAVALALRT